ncbi:hypothetical protein [Arcticibacter sp. MXS-1]|uniref:hypothetical protein n=1 Tax=Arcticibacter sp. MXS-1 TaxID=3341726 RepID=UPI0035A8AF6D
MKRKLQIRENAPTILLGYSAGADLVYGTLCQAPPGVFKGAIVIGFCPDLAVRIPFCKGSGKFDMIPWTKKNGYNFGPCTNLAEPFISLQGMKDGVCNYQATQSFLEEVQNAKLVKLPHTGHMYFIYKR